MSLRGRAWLALGACLYVGALSFSYVSDVTPRFAYLGYGYVEPQLTAILFSAAIAIVPALWLPLSLTRPSQLVYWLLYVIVYIPSLVIPPLAVDPNFTFVFFLDALLLAGFGLVGAISSLALIRLPRPAVPDVIFWNGVILASLGTDAFIVSQFGLHLHFLTFSDIIDVYGVRLDYRAAVAQTDSLVAYAIGWQTNVLNPLLMVRGIVARKPIPFLLGVVGQVAIFEISGFKTVLLSTGLIIVLFGIIKLRQQKFGVTLVWGAPALIVTAIFADVISGSIVFTSLFVRRLLVTPGLLTGDYVQFFSTSPQMLLSHSVLGSFIQNPYGTLTPPFLIGAVYFHNPSDSANANVWADAFANFGPIGVICFSLLLGTILWVFDCLTRRCDRLIAALLLAMPAFALSNSGLLTTLLTHGLLVGMVAASFLPNTIVRGVLATPGHRLSERLGEPGLDAYVAKT